MKTNKLVLMIIIAIAIVAAWFEDLDDWIYVVIITILTAVAFVSVCFVGIHYYPVIHAYYLELCSKLTW